MLEEPELRKVDEGADKRNRTSKGKGLSLPTFRKIGEFLANVLTLERSVDALKDRTKSLEAEVQRLQRQVDEQAGELKVLVTFVHSSLRDQIEGRAERAAIRVFERLASMQKDELQQSQIEQAPPGEKAVEEPAPKIRCPEFTTSRAVNLRSECCAWPS
jgi:chaperonin cofactor prefoldin